MQPGIQTREGGNIRYVGTIGARFTLRVPSDTENAITRVNKNGVEVSERQFTSFAGYLYDISTTRHEQYGPQWLLDFLVKDEIWRLTLQAAAHKSTGMLIRRIPSVVPMELVEVNIGGVTETGKDGKEYLNQIFWMRQEVNGETVKVGDYFRDKDGDTYIHKHGFPEAEWIPTVDTFGGEKMVLSFSKQNMFLKEFMDNNVRPTLLGANPGVSVPDPVPDEAPEYHTTDHSGEIGPGDDDLPF